MLQLPEDRKVHFLAACLLDAIQDENFSNVRRLVNEHSVDAFSVIPGRGIAAIHYAAGMDNVTFGELVVELLLNTDDPTVKHAINVQTDDGETALHVAAFWGRTKICQWLLQHGANICIQDGDKLTPLDCALNEGHFHVVRIMQNHIFEMKLKTSGRATPTNPSSTNYNLQLPSNLSSGIYTPNRIHYNYDVTSPYFINITHRRKCWNTHTTKSNSIENSAWLPKTMMTQTSVPLHSSSDESDDEQVVKTRPKNLFDLTEENVRQFTVITDADDEASTQISLVERWRSKVNQQQRQSMCPTNLDELPSIMESFDLLNSACDSVFDEKLSSTRNSELVLHIDKAESNESYQTAQEEPVLIRSPRHNNPDFLYQMTEEYVHTDAKSGINLYERKVLSDPTSHFQDVEANISTASTEFSISLDYDTDLLRAELTQFGAAPGPIAATTKRLYLKRLQRFKRNPELVARQQAVQQCSGEHPIFSWELERTVRRDDWQTAIISYMDSQTKLVDHFASQNLKKANMREGHRKTSFIYLLLDPRITENLPGESRMLTKLATWEAFLRSIFYVGKGKNSRPYSHLYDAIKFYQRETCNDVEGAIDIVRSASQPKAAIKRRLYDAASPSKRPVTDSVKLRRIIDIWKSGKGVVCLHVFHNILPEDAMSREAAIIDAIGLDNLTNMKRGDYYGISQSWTMRERKQLGVALLYKSLHVLLAEGESQLRPNDIL